MPKSPTHPISSPIPELQGIASIARPTERRGLESYWRERWYGSEPQRGSAIVTERGNLVAYFGGTERLHKIVRQVVAAHNAALTAVPPQDEWMSIETAPKDGSYIIAARFGAMNELRWVKHTRWLTVEEIAAAEFSDDPDEFDAGWSDGNDDHEPIYPTHWKPLCAPRVGK